MTQIFIVCTFPRDGGVSSDPLPLGCWVGAVPSRTWDLILGQTGGCSPFGNAGTRQTAYLLDSFSLNNGATVHSRNECKYSLKASDQGRSVIPVTCFSF